jgi:colanic acid/amylovoran biosynthesis protein
MSLADDPGEAVARRPLRVGLLWHSAASANLGVAALTVANLALAREAAEAVGLEAEFTLYGMRGEAPAAVTPGDVGLFNLDGRALIPPGGFWRSVRDQDCLLDIGGGADSFAEIYGPKRFFYLWSTKMMALARGVPLLLSPQTIGPFQHAAYRGLARLALDRAAAVYARDDLSLDVLSDIAPHANARLSVDVAFALPFEDRRRQRGGEKLRVGVNVSGLMFNDAVSGANRFGVAFDYAVLMRRFLAELAADPRVEIHLIKHVASREGGPDNDAPVAQMLAAEFPGAVLVADFEGPSEAKSYISSLDFLVGGRMHACIAAFSAGVPVVPVAYSRKVSGLFGMLGYPSVVPDKGMNTDQALAFLLRSFSRRTALQKELRTAMGRVAGLLDVYRTGLRSFFAEVAQGRRGR